jgi:hypothetical protein
VKQRRFRSRLAGISATAVAVGLIAAAAIPTLAPAASESPTANTVVISAKGGLRFETPKTIVDGEDLTVLNTTDAHKVGPHTFSLVTQSSLPKTPNARKLCFTPKHICKAIAAWHGVKGNGPPKVNPAEAGPEGWSTMGSLTKKGDSWFTGSKPKATFTQKVDVDTSAGPTRIYFMCAVHPWMHGSINVLPAPAS